MMRLEGKIIFNPPVSVYKSVESKSISPAGGEILNVDLRVPDMDKIKSDDRPSQLLFLLVAISF